LLKQKRLAVDFCCVGAEGGLEGRGLLAPGNV